MNAFPREGWLGYKILCARTLNDNQMALNYLDSLMDYHHSVGSCYPANHLLKAQFMEQMGRFEDACEVYKSYAHINDSIRSSRTGRAIKQIIPCSSKWISWSTISWNCGRRSTAISL